MAYVRFNTALIVGAGSGLSAALARALKGRHPGGACGADTHDLPLADETGAQTYACDASRPDDVERLFDELDRELRAPEIVIYNASHRVRGPLVDLDPAEVERSISPCRPSAASWLPAGGASHAAARSMAPSSSPALRPA